jgi:hypothetical protein
METGRTERGRYSCGRVKIPEIEASAVPKLVTSR